MSILSYPLTLDTSRKNAFKTVLAQQYDTNSRELVITLSNDNVQFIADNTMTAVLNGTYEDETPILPLACTINEDGTVTAPITSMALTQTSGLYSLTVTIYNSDSERLGVFPFTLEVTAGSTVPLDSFDDESVELLTELISETRDAIHDAEQASVLRGSVTPTESGATITVTDQYGTTEADIYNGADGRDGRDGTDGFSPIASVSKVGDTATISITDANGTTTASVKDGRDGTDGRDGSDGSDGTSAYASVTKSGDTATITCTDAHGTTTATVKDGSDGVNGTDGVDGTSAFASVSKSGDTAIITCTDANGTTTATVKDGTDGRDGTDGISPTATVSKSGDVVTISITDREGTTTATVSDGYSKAQVDTFLDAKEDVANKVDSYDEDSTSDQYPSAKAVYDAEERIVYCGRERGGDEVILVNGGIDNNLAKWTMAENDTALLFDRNSVANVTIENETDGARIAYVLLSEAPNVVAGENINGKLYGRKIDAGTSYTFSTNSYWNQSAYLWLQYTFTGQTYKYKLLTVTLTDGRTLTLYSNGTLDLDVLKNPSIFDRIDALETATTELRIENPTVARYMDEIDYSDDTGYTQTIMSNVANGYTANSTTAFDYKTCRPRTFDISWDAYSGASKYAITVGNRTYYTTSTSISISNLVPNTTYKWAVYAMTSGSYKRIAIKSGTVNVIGQVRMFNASDVYNMRDLGGWRTMYGKTVKYGRLVRGACLDQDDARSKVDADGITEMLANGLTVEVDLRGEEGHDYTQPTILKERYNCITDSYVNGLTTHPERFVRAIQQIIKSLSEGKGVYVHCVQGADRTGTVCMLIEALLGMSDLDCSVEYELTAFNMFQNRSGNATANSRAVNYYNEKPYKEMMEWFETGYPSATYPTLHDKVTAWYLAQSGTSMDEISTLRKELLDNGAEDEAFDVNFTATLDTQTMTPVFSCDKTYEEIEMAINSGDLIKFTLDGSQVGMDNNYTTMNYNLNSGSGYIRVNILVGNVNHALSVNNNGTIYYDSYEFVTQ